MLVPRYPFRRKTVIAASRIARRFRVDRREFKHQPGKNIQVPGSPTLVRSLLRDGLLDELSLAICPLVVGAGMRLFEEISEPLPLKLAESRSLSTGVLGVTYRPASA